MITQFKLFENDTPNNLYEEGDYVLLESDYFTSFGRDETERRGIIDGYYYHRDDGYEYDISLNAGYLERGVFEYGIERKLTEEEIELLHIENAAKPYNI